MVDKKSDLNVSYSQASGLFGAGSATSIGTNWYPLGKLSMKISFDATYLDSSPLQNSTSGILEKMQIQDNR